MQLLVAYVLKPAETGEAVVDVEAEAAAAAAAAAAAEAAALAALAAAAVADVALQQYLAEFQHPIFFVLFKQTQ